MIKSFSIFISSAATDKCEKNVEHFGLFPLKPFYTYSNGCPYFHRDITSEVNGIWA